MLIELNIITRPEMDLCGRVLPKGVIYGEDSNGVFFCRDYRIIRMTKNNRPIMTVYRLNSKGDFYMGEEANETTEAILDLYMAHEEACNIPDTYVGRGWNPKAKGRKISVHIAKKIKTPFYGCDEHRLMPKGAVYGHDGFTGKDGTKGFFYCVDFDNVKFNRRGYPVLWVWRPVMNDNKYRMEWTKQKEASCVTQAIFKLWLKEQEKCRLDYGDEVAELAKQQFKARPGWNDGIPWKGMRVMPNQEEPKTCFTYVIGTKTLEQRAAEQRTIKRTK